MFYKRLTIFKNPWAMWWLDKRDPGESRFKEFEGILELLFVSLYTWVILGTAK
jgi:hypothetical protein